MVDIADIQWEDQTPPNEEPAIQWEDETKPEQAAPNIQWEDTPQEPDMPIDFTGQQKISTASDLPIEATTNYLKPYVKGDQQLTTKKGRPLFQDSDGNFVSEKTVTVTDPRVNDGKPTNIPTVYDGRILTEDQAIQVVAESKGIDPVSGEQLKPFDTIEEAIQAAEERSKDLGQSIETQIDMPLEFSGKPPKVKDRQENETSLMGKIKNDLLITGKQLKLGLDISTAEAANLMANIPMLISGAEDYLREKTGQEPLKESVFKQASEWLRNTAKGYQPSQDQMPKDILGKIYTGIGQTPGTLVQYLPAVKALGATKGMALMGALKEADKGGKKAAQSAIEHAIMGKTLEALSPFAMEIRATSMAAMGGAQTAVGGGEVSDVIANSLTGGMLGAIGPRQGVTLKDLKPQAKLNTPEAAIVHEVEAAKKTSDFAGNIRLEKYDSEQGVKQLLKDVSDKHADFSAMRRDVVSHEETRMLAQDMGMSYEKLTQRTKGQAFNAHEAYAARVLLAKSADETFALSKKVEGGSAEDLVNFEKALTRHAAIQEQVAGMTAEAGRALNQFKMNVETDKAKVQALNDLVELTGGRGKIEATAKALAKAQENGNFNEVARKLTKPKPSDMALEVWINGLLSGPQTHAVNMTSNALTALWTLPENVIAAGIGKLHGGEKVYFRDVAARGFGFIEGAKTGTAKAWEALKSGESESVRSKMEMPRQKAIPGKVGEVVRLPGRFLTAEDEFFREVGYRMELNSLAHRQAISEGLKGQQLAKRIEELKVSPTEEMHLKAEYNAQYQTFTKQLGEFGQSLQSMANKHKALRMVVPFIRTPLNIVKFAGERTPFALASKAVRDEMRKGGVARDQQIARMAMGSMVTATVGALVAEKMITGGGPSEPKQRQMLYATGWQPYSFKIGDKYYSYARIEPLGMLFGISADAAEIMDKLDKKEANKLGSMALMSISKNLTSKTWLKGISDAIQAINDPDRYGERYIQNFVGSGVPSFVAQIARTNDPVLRETNTFLEKIKSRIPGISTTLLPKRNIWGEQIDLEGGLGPDIISPIYQSTKKNDKVSDEMVRLEIAPGLPRDKLSKVKLTPQQYDDYVQLSGKPLKQFLDQTVNTPEWDKIPDLVKRQMIEKSVMEYRNYAKARMIMKYPELLQNIVQEELKKYQIK